METYRVMVVEPGKAPVEKRIGLKEIHDYVGELIQELPLFSDKMILFNQLAKEQEQPVNRRMILREKGNIPITIRGTFVIAKKSNDNYDQFSDEEVQEIQNLYKQGEANEAVYI